jgi:predicted enzyme related to lactoylglutathione lyase
MPRDRKLDYLELYGADLGAMKRFYSAAFSWSFVDYGDNYVGFAEAGLDGGIQGEEPAPPLPILYAADLEGAAESVGQVGGAITRAIYAFPAGDGSTSAIRAATSSRSGRTSRPRHNLRLAAEAVRQATAWRIDGRPGVSRKVRR